MWVGSQKTKLIASKRTQFMPSVRSVPEAQRLASVARRMSALGHKRTLAVSALPPKSRHWADASAGLLRPGQFGRILGLKDVKLSLRAAELANIRLAQPRRTIATKDLAMVRVIKNSFKS